jgi:AraC family transcriptional regulator, transcriptional activator of pobA
MEIISSTPDNHLIKLTTTNENALPEPVQFHAYTILFIPEGAGIYHADFAIFPFKGPVLLFATPYQVLHIKQRRPLALTMLQFHGDFYCIEFHRAEVACNGLLFNNIYLQPFVTLSQKEAGDFQQLLLQMKAEMQQASSSDIVLKAYLQLFLAKSGSIKMKSVTVHQQEGRDEQMEQFSQLLDEHYLTLHKPADYAQLLAMPPDNLTKRCKRYFKKSPSQLIRERLMLQAKKLLHLTRKSIKEIAGELNFEDEFYFSRVFKKFTRVSPQTFRNETGISVMADLSM